MKLFSLTFYSLLITSTIAIADDDIQTLTSNCEDARQQKLTPLRNEAISKCVSNDKKSTDAKQKCERFYADFGAAVRYKSGGHKERMFNDLPECLKLYAAEQKNKSTER